MQNTHHRLAAPNAVRRDVRPFMTPKTEHKPASMRAPEACGFTRREVRALVAEMLG